MAKTPGAHRARIETLDRFHQTNIALLNQIRMRQTVREVTPGQWKSPDEGVKVRADERLHITIMWKRSAKRVSSAPESIG
jgi:hypothetical protein